MLLSSDIFKISMDKKEYLKKYTQTPQAPSDYQQRTKKRIKEPQKSYVSISGGSLERSDRKPRKSLKPSTQPTKPSLQAEPFQKDPERIPESGLLVAKDLKALDQESKQTASAKKREMQENQLYYGVGTSTIIRDAETGRILDKAEMKQKALEERLKKERQTQMEWGEGLVQRRESELLQSKLELQSSQPFAILKSDDVLNEKLKQRYHWGDPMASNRIEKSSSRLKRPMYKGNAFSNRFGILPGHRWDGVDRSNGWEKERFKITSRRDAGKSDAYITSVEDL